MHGRTWRLGAAIIGALAAFGGATGTAAAALPSCSAGVTDPSGDALDRSGQLVNPNGLLDPVAVPAQDNEDLLGFAVTTALDGTVTVTVKVADLDKTVPADSTGLSWYFGYTIDGLVPEFVSASTDGKNYTFSYGHVDARTGVYTTDGDTAGQATEGPNGTLSILIPDSFSGDTLTQTYATSFQELGATVPAVGSAASLSTADAAPDGGGEGGTNAPDCLVD